MTNATCHCRLTSRSGIWIYSPHNCVEKIRAQDTLPDRIDHDDGYGGNSNPYLAPSGGKDCGAAKENKLTVD